MVIRTISASYFPPRYGLADTKRTIIMLYSSTFLSVAALSALQVHGMAEALAERATPAVYLAGDRTMARMDSPIDGEAL